MEEQDSNTLLANGTQRHGCRLTCPFMTASFGTSCSTSTTVLLLVINSATSIMEATARVSGPTTKNTTSAASLAAASSTTRPGCHSSTCRVIHAKRGLERRRGSC